MQSFYDEFQALLIEFSNALRCSIWLVFSLNFSNQLYTRPTTVTECGHRFCGDCIKENLGVNCLCPYCGQPARGKNLRISPLHSNLVNWTRAMLTSLEKFASSNDISFPRPAPETPVLSYSQAASIDGVNDSFDSNTSFETEKAPFDSDSKSPIKSRSFKRVSFPNTSNIKSHRGGSVISPKASDKIKAANLSAGSKSETFSLMDLISSGTVPIGSVAYCFDCTAKITSSGSLIDEIDLQEYFDPSDWATYVVRCVENRRLSRQDGLKAIKVGGKTLEELYSSVFVQQSTTRNDPVLKQDTNVFSLAEQSPQRIVKLSTSSLSRDQSKFLELHSRNHLQYSLNLSPDPDISGSTYLVVDTDSNQRCRRTLKYLFACMLKIPVVSFQCMIASINH